MIGRLRETANELWHRKNTFLLVAASLGSGLPIASAMEDCLPLHEPLGSEIDKVRAALLQGKSLCEIASQDFDGAPPRWLTIASRYEQKGQVRQAFMRLSRFADKSLPSRIILNQIFWRSEPERLRSWLPLIFMGLLFLPVLPWHSTKDGIVVLGIFKGDSSNIYSVPGLSELGPIMEEGEVKDSSLFHKLYAYVDQPIFLETMTRKKDFVPIARSYGYTKDEANCIWTKELYGSVMQDGIELTQILDRIAPSPVPAVWIYRGVIVSMLKLIGEPNYSEIKKNVEQVCATSRLHQRLEKLASK